MSQTHTNILIGNKFTKEKKVIKQPVIDKQSIDKQVTQINVKPSQNNQSFQMRKVETPVLAPYFSDKK